MFVTGLIGGLIVVMHPFTVVPIFFMLQIFFYFATLTWITTIMINETVFLWEAIGRMTIIFFFLVFGLLHISFSVGCVVLYSFFVLSIIFLQLTQNSKLTAFYADISKFSVVIFYPNIKYM